MTAHPKLNVFTGGNGAGKTSLLESVFLLGRGRSFRNPDLRALVRAGAPGFTVVGTTEAVPSMTVRIDYRQGRANVDIDGQGALGARELLEAFCVQALDSETHMLVRGPPLVRRQLLDWGVFHVKQSYLPDWRRFRRALLQRNTALRRGDSQQALAVWDDELAAAAEPVNEQREQHARELAERFCQMAAHDLGLDTELQFSRGWPLDQDYRECLAASHSGDTSRGTTLYGPQRADLKILLDEHSGRNWASTGQQKLIGAALILAQTLIVAEKLQRPVALVVDEPAADLDRAHLSLLMKVLESTPLQLFVACLDADALPIFTERHLFHVEHGGVKPLI